VQLWELAAREQVRDLAVRYHAAGDRGRVDEVVALFSPDGALVVDGVEHTGHDEIRALLSTAAGPVPERVAHFIGTVQLDVHDADHAGGECYFQVLTPAGLDHWGRYRDRYLRIDGAWRFARRSVRVDGAVPGGWAARRGYPAARSAHDAP
jgi:hypothetical protein